MPKAGDSMLHSTFQHTPDGDSKSAPSGQCGATTLYDPEIMTIYLTFLPSLKSKKKDPWTRSISPASVGKCAADQDTEFHLSRVYEGNSHPVA